MSHYTVLVAASDKDDLEKKMMPYHEYECTGFDEFTEEVVLHKKEDFRVDALNILVQAREIKAEEAERIMGVEIGDIAAAREIVAVKEETYLEWFLNGRYTDIFGEWDGGSLSEGGDWVRKTNPNAKWDWWVVGGRWSGFLPLKPLDEEPDRIAESGVGTPGTFGVLRRGDEFVDFARKDAIDWERIYQERVDEILDDWKTVDWLLEWAGLEMNAEEWITLSVERQKEIKEDIVGILDGLAGGVEEDIIAKWYTFSFFAPNFPTREAASAHKNGGPISYAFIDEDGHWFQSGQMGWFGLDSDRRPMEYADEWREFLARIPGDQMLYLVDCHI